MIAPPRVIAWILIIGLVLPGGVMVVSGQEQDNREPVDSSIDFLFTQELDILQSRITTSTVVLGISVGLVTLGGAALLTIDTLSPSGAGFLTAQQVNLANGVNASAIALGVTGTIVSFIIYAIMTDQYQKKLKTQSEYWNLIR